MSKTAKIISDDVRFARMLAISLESFGIVIENGRSPIKETELDYVIADLDSITDSELIKYSKNTVLIGFSHKDEDDIIEKAPLCAQFFHRPFLMHDFLSIFGERKRVLHERSYPKRETYKKSDFLSVSEIDKAAIWGDQLIPLSENEYKVLSLLCENRREVVERERIYAELGAEDGNMGDVYICHLRKKLDNKLGIKLIYTIRGKGYMLKN